MATTINQFDAELRTEVWQRIVDALATQGGPALRHVHIEAREHGIVLGGEVHSYYAKQILLHTALREARGVPILDEVRVVRPAAFRDPGRLLRAASAGLTLAILLALASGCGSSDELDRPPVFPVTGQVTIDGRPAAGAFVSFHPKSGGGFPTPRAQVDPQGNFALSTYATSDGAPLGEYAVTVTLERIVKKGDDYERGPNVLPPRYSIPQTTVVVARVAEGPNTVPIKLVR